MNRETWKGIAIGFGVGIMAPMVFPVVARAAKPTMAAAIRAGVGAWDRGREAVAEMGEYAEDMMAEARARRNGGTSMAAGGTASGMEAGGG